MAKKRRRKTTAEEEARFERNTRMIEERLAYRRARDREMEAAREREKE